MACSVPIRGRDAPVGRRRSRWLEKLGNDCRMIVVPILPALIACATLLIPVTEAAQSTVWNFRGSIPQGVTVQHLTTVEGTLDGLYIDTQTDGFVQLPTLTHAADVLRLRVTNAAPAEIAVLWRTPDLNPGEYYQENVVLPAGEGKEVSVLLHQVPEWAWSAPFLGLAFPTGSKLLIEELEWKRYSIGEKLMNGFASFWTPDQFRLYSINFLWGPLLAPTPEARATLYDSLPPRSWSATRIFYAVLIAAIVIAAILRWTMPEFGTKRMLATLTIVGAALWIVFDLRMTQEILAYVRDDWQTYVLEEPGKRTLRSHVTLYDALEVTDDVLGDDDRYVLVAQENTPFFSNVRYALYPAVPVRIGESTEGVRTWIIFARDDVTAENGTLAMRDGTVLAQSGSVLHRFDDTSFIFRQ